MKPSRRFLKLTVVFAVLHGAAFLASFLTSFSGTMYRFDHPEVVDTLLDKICTVLTSILIEPYLGLAGKLGYHGRVLDLAGMLLNSLLWGAAFSTLYGKRQTNFIFGCGCGVRSVCIEEQQEL